MLDHLCVHSRTVVLGSQYQGQVSRRRRYWICKQCKCHFTRLDHLGHAHAQPVQATDEKVAQNRRGVHVCGRSIVSYFISLPNTWFEQ